MQIISLNNTHITSTDKKHIVAFLNSGQTQAKINRATWVVMKGDGKGEFELLKIVNDRGIGFIGDKLRESKYTYHIKAIS